MLNGGVVNLKMSPGGTASANWEVYGGSRIAHGRGGLKDAAGLPLPWTCKVGGVLDVRGTTADPSLISGSGSDGDRLVGVSARLIGEADALLRVTCTADEGDFAGKGFTCVFSGTNDAYRGSFRIDGGGGEMMRPWELHFRSSAALGAPVPDGPKVTLGDGVDLLGAGLAFTNGYAIALEGNTRFCPTGAAAISWRRECEGFFLGNGGSVTRTGDSVVTQTAGSPISLGDVTFTGVARFVSEDQTLTRVYPEYDQPGLPLVIGGALIDSSEHVGPVTLKHGAYLQPGFGTMYPDGFASMGWGSPS